MAKLSIAQAASYYPPDFGGIESYVYNISIRMARKGHRVVVLTSEHPRCSQVEVVEGVEVRRLRVAKKFFGFPLMPSLPTQIASEDFDVVHGHINAPLVVDLAALASRASHTPLVVTYHADLLPEEVAEGSIALAKALSAVYDTSIKRWVLRQARAIIATTPLYASTSPYLRKFLRKVRIAPVGVDVEHFKPMREEGLREDLGIPKDLRVVLFVGRMVAYKALDILLAAFAKLAKAVNDVALVLVGEGPRKSWASALAIELSVKNRVFVVGNVPLETLPKVYAMSELVVVPSRSRAEAFSVTALEAMACGKPVVATRVGGVPYVVVDGVTGVLVPPKNAEALCEAMLSLLSNEDEARRLGEAGRRRAVELFSWDRVVNLIEDVYLSVAV